MISYCSENTKVPKFSRRLITNWIKLVSGNYNRKLGEISFIFCDDEKILEVNNQYLKHDYFTDIITFDYCEGKVLNGDIFISLDTVNSNATKYKVDFDAELSRVMIHGILHLCGQADKSPEERAEMTRKENEALYLLNTLHTKNI
jgi:rRNA maturation RNase YbeY